jgi:hypothetical protein
MRLPDPPSVAAALDAAYAGITSVVADLDDVTLLGPTGCRGWLVTDLLLHICDDAQRTLVGLATPADGPADVDFVSYWHAYPGRADSAEAAEHAQAVRRTAAAFRLPTGVVRLWRDLGPAAARASVAAVRGVVQPVFRPVEVAIFADRPAAPGPFVATQGHVIAVPDFIATVVTEAAIHHLDLIRHLPDAPPPAPEAVVIALSTLEGLAPDGGLPAHWAPTVALLKATGRAPFDDTDRRALGATVDRYPLLG